MTKIAGEGKVESVEADGESFAVNGVFVALGAASATDLARKIGAGVTGNAIAVDADFATTVPGLMPRVIAPVEFCRSRSPWAKAPGPGSLPFLLCAKIKPRCEITRGVMHCSEC